MSLQRLRIAGYCKFARSNGSIPFLADDIIDSFEDERAGEVFHLLAEMGRTREVICLTHRTSLCDIAK